MINHEIIGKGFENLLPPLVQYVSHEMQVEFGEEWWSEGVLGKLYEDQKKNLPLEGSIETLKKSMDINLCLTVIDIRWNDVFRKKLSIDHRNWDKELIGYRNKWAHFTTEDFNDADTERALDTMIRMCEQLDSIATEEIRKLYRTVRYGSEGGTSSIVSNSSESDEPLPSSPVKTSGLPSWRDIIEPHPDVAQGRYKNAEFAADLSQVVRGEAAMEYQDPVEFFARTYITDGMKRLLVESLRRVCGTSGEPVIQLKTAFGGGKTHTMLALYHLLRGRAPLEKIPSIKPVLDEAGVELTQVHVAVIVGTALDPAKSRRPNNMPGITINTLWGEIAAQLAESASKPELYNYVKASDSKHVSPGSKALIDLFNECGPCMILMDEIVAYAKKLYGSKDLVAGTFDNLITFIQELTEAARASKNCLIVASIPESNIEIGGEAGQQTLTAIEHTFGRMESIWKPVAANEGFEVVRRRLFLPCKDIASRDLVCNAYSDMYLKDPSNFPIETKELDYKNRMISCYPIHPEVFERLYEDWATLDRFQKTRGVLRLMASVISDLWMKKDSDPMIMPGSISLDNSDIKNELTRYLEETWNSIVDNEVDGKGSIPYTQDKHEPRFGKVMACRRVSRTIFLGSAPTVEEQSIRGIDVAHIRLGAVQPGESVGLFDDAINKLNDSLAYLYSNPTDSRFWFDTRPTLRKTAQDRASQISDSEIEHEIEQRLGQIKKDESLSGIHVCPNSSLDVPDDPSVRLVILRTCSVFKDTPSGNDAIISAEKYLNTRGNNPRKYRNMLVFMAPDAEILPSLKSAVKIYLAWKSIKNDRELLNLDVVQNRETENNVKGFSDTVNLRIRETYCWLMVPYIDRTDIKTMIWEKTRISGGSEPIVQKAVNKLKQNESLITRWAPALLLHELDSLLWKDSDDISIKTLWEQLCMYCYLPRLASYSVLENAIKDGLNSAEYFAIASGKSEGRYLELKINTYLSSVDLYKLLVKIDKAHEQLEAEATPVPQQPKPEGGTVVIEGGPAAHNSGPVSPVPEESGPKHFHMSKDLDYVRVNKEVKDIVDEVVRHIDSIEGSSVRITITVEADIPDGAKTDKVRTVTENCRTLKIDDSGFY